jgi:hypothetical protein
VFQFLFINSPTETSLERILKSLEVVRHYEEMVLLVWLIVSISFCWGGSPDGKKGTAKASGVGRRCAVGVSLVLQTHES